jgi:hypothetical protein
MSSCDRYLTVVNFLFFSGVALLGAFAVVAAPSRRPLSAASHSADPVDPPFAPVRPALAT